MLKGVRGAANVSSFSVVFIFWPDFQQWDESIWDHVLGIDKQEQKGSYEL